jgi:hypothetical protein
MNTLINGLLVVYTVMRLWIGLTLFNTARKNRLTNLYWLALVFGLNVIQVPFAPSVGNPLGNLPGLSLWLFNATQLVIAGALAAFTQTTFHLHRKSPLGWLLAMYVVLVPVGLYGLAVSPSNFIQAPGVAAIWVPSLLIWAWHGDAALRAYQGVAHDPTVEDWVKARYTMMVAFSALTVISASTGVFRVILAGGGGGSLIGNGMGLVNLVCQLFSVSLQFLAWVMPNGFRRWLNRHYQPPLTLDLGDLTEDEVFKP